MRHVPVAAAALVVALGTTVALLMAGSGSTVSAQSPTCKQNGHYSCSPSPTPSVSVSTSPTSTTTSLPPPPATWSTTATYRIGTGQDAYLGNTANDRYVIIQEPAYIRIPAIHTANPNTTVLAYQEAGASSSNSSYGCNPPFPHLTFGTDYCYMKANYPAAFVKATSAGVAAQDATYSDFPDYHAMDPGSADYRSQWAAQVNARIVPDGFQGVEADDTNVNGFGHGLPASLWHADGTSYASTAYGTDWVGWAGAVVPQLTGLAYFGNYACDPWNTTCEPNVLNAAKVVGGGHLREFWMRFPGSPVMTGAEFTSMLGQFENEQANGGRYIAMTTGALTETAVMRYGRAAFLLGWNGQDGSAMTYNCNENADCHNGNWTIQIGTPTDARAAVGVGWIRHYTGGVVTINPSSSTAQVFSLGGSYVDQDGVTRSSITLQPGTAMVFKL